MTTEHEASTPKPGSDDIARRKAAVARLLAVRAHMPSIAPFTTAELVHLAREDATWYGGGED